MKTTSSVDAARVELLLADRAIERDRLFRRFTPEGPVGQRLAGFAPLGRDALDAGVHRDDAAALAPWQ